MIYCNKGLRSTRKTKQKIQSWAGPISELPFLVAWGNRPNEDCFNWVNPSILTNWIRQGIKMILIWREISQRVRDKESKNWFMLEQVARKDWRPERATAHGAIGRWMYLGDDPHQRLALVAFAKFYWQNKVLFACHALTSYVFQQKEKSNTHQGNGGGEIY